MITFNTGTCHLLKTPPDIPKQPGTGTVVEDEVNEQVPAKADYILCRHCGSVITSLDERISVSGSHQHMFANPQRIVLELGCFRSAPGRGYSGPSTDEFTWFRGFSWKVAVCRTCFTHLGWLFVSKSSNSFNGLILDHLIY